MVLMALSLLAQVGCFSTGVGLLASCRGHVRSNMCGSCCCFSGHLEREFWHFGKQLNRVVLWDNVLTSPCRWQGCPSLSHLLWLDKIFIPSDGRECSHTGFLLNNAEDNFRFVCLKGLNLWTFCSVPAVSHPSHCSPTDLLYSPHPQHDQWFPQDSSSNTVKQMSNEDVISSLLAMGWG